eukprot:383933-Amphidinium_carterae.1
MALEQEAKEVTGIQVAHVPGSANCAADSLSRRHAPEAASVSIDAKEVTVPSRPSSFYRLPPPGKRPDLWGLIEKSSAR